MTPERVVYRFLRASSPLWAGAVEAVTKFQAACDAIRRGEEEAIRQARFVPSDFAITFAGAFVDWADAALGSTWSQNQMEALRRVAKESFEEGGSGGDLTEAVGVYEREVGRLVSLAGEPRFVYEGFSIENEDRLGDDVVRTMLEGIDYVVGLFKRRGLDKALAAGVSKVRLKATSGEGQVAGHYFPGDRSINLYADSLVGQQGRFLEVWAGEVFLHEFGHFVHMALIPKEAMGAWNAGWDEVVSKKEQYEEAFQKITRRDRGFFWAALEKTGYQPVKAAAKMKALHKVKFGVWLREPDLGGPFITPAQFRLTKEGDAYFAFFRDPEAFILEEKSLTPADPEYGETYQRMLRQKLGRLGMRDNDARGIPSKIIEELTQADPSYQAAVDEALAKLEIVSDYGRTNEKEDFAESFVAFMAAPEKLTPTAKYRMQRTLSVAGLYGKPVLRLAAREDTVDGPFGLQPSSPRSTTA